MANTLKKAVGQASIAGTTIYTVPASTIITIVGLRGANTDSTEHDFHVEVAGQLVTGTNTPLPVGSALDAMNGSKIVAEAGDTIVAYADTDSVIDIYVSFLEQT